jgi:hypothetical protein
VPRDRFAPVRLHRYTASIDEQVAQAERSFYVSDDLRFLTDADRVTLVGTIECEGGIRIEVEERFRLLRGPWWLTLDRAGLMVLDFYRYNAVLLNRGPIFRYNSPHADHRTYHHVHRFDVLGSGKEQVDRLSERNVPSLREILRRAEDWYWEHIAKRAGNDA